MARRMRRIVITTPLGENFFNKMDAARRVTQKKLGIKNLSHRQFTEMLAKDPRFRFPDIKIGERQFVKRKKR